MPKLRSTYYKHLISFTKGASLFLGKLITRFIIILLCKLCLYWATGIVSVLDSGAEGLGFKSLLRHCRVTVLVKLFTPIVPLFTKQQIQ